MIVKEFIKKSGEKYFEVIIDLEVPECRVSKVIINGDFFAAKPEFLEEMTEKLRGADAASTDWVGTLLGMYESAHIYGVSRDSVKKVATSIDLRVRKLCRER